ncbi:MAG: hypothetical protein JW839_12025 [Candidatus Lokiarchaeota archaeon]|nr:hypothetical protein [Candidatus Lokiarchaeota archaeon]
MTIAEKSQLPDLDINGAVHDFLEKKSFSEELFVNVIKECIRYVKDVGFPPKRTSIQYIVDIEEPSWQYLRVLIVLPVDTLREALKIQNDFYDNAYKNVLKRSLDNNMNLIDAFHKQVNIVFKHINY